jgi:hypothetical protein
MGIHMAIPTMAATRKKVDVTARLDQRQEEKSETWYTLEDIGFVLTHDGNIRIWHAVDSVIDLN